MKSALDSSVIVSALCAGDPDHSACRKVLLSGRHSVLAHAFTETFSTLNLSDFLSFHRPGDPEILSP